MSNFTGPKIPKPDKMLFRYDAANIKSYGDGTGVLSDLSRSGQSSTNYGTVGHSSLGPLSTFNFNGSGDYFLLDGSDQYDYIVSGTFTAWINADAFDRDGVFSAASQSNVARWNRFAVRSEGSGGKIAIGGQFDGSPIAIQTGSQSAEVTGLDTVLSTGTWYHLSWSGNNVSWRCHINGVPETLSDTGGSDSNVGYWLDFYGTPSEPTKYSMGCLIRSSGPTDYFDGKMGIMTLWREELSDEEIKQDFEATRGRYGV
jgi:hypothetical protein